MIKSCLFDMGNVLVHFCHQTMCRNVADVCGLTEQQVTELLLSGGLQWQLERGEISEVDFHARFEDIIGRTVCIDSLRHAAANIFQLNESIVPLLDELKSLQIRLVLLSNTSITHMNFIRRNFDVLDRFDAFTTSYETGSLKPDPVIYQAAVRNAGCDAAECFYTDDIEAYVRQAESMGIHADVYTDTDSTRTALRRLGVPVQPAGSAAACSSDNPTASQP